MATATSVAQTIYYSYDKSGNRTMRSINLSGNKSATLDDDVEEGETEPFDDFVVDIPIKIYPNPTKGRLMVEIQQIEKDPITIVVYDLKGQAIMTIPEAVVINVLDISNCKNGIYIMKITIGQKSQTWKILKN